MKEYILENHKEDGWVVQVYVNGLRHTAYYLFWEGGYTFLINDKRYRSFFLELIKVFCILAAANLTLQQIDDLKPF